MGDAAKKTKRGAIPDGLKTQFNGEGGLKGEGSRGGGG